MPLLDPLLVRRFLFKLSKRDKGLIHIDLLSLFRGNKLHGLDLCLLEFLSQHLLILLQILYYLYFFGHITLITCNLHSQFVFSICMFSHINMLHQRILSKWFYLILDI